MLSGFRASHVFRQPVQVDHDSYRAPDPVDDADFELPNGNTLVEAFMAGLAKEVYNDYRGLSKLLASLPDPSASRSQPEAVSYSEARSKGLVSSVLVSEDTLKAFSPSEMKLYKHATSHKWTADELISTIKLIKSADFNVDDINVDLH